MSKAVQVRGEEGLIGSEVKTTHDTILVNAIS